MKKTWIVFFLCIGLFFLSSYSLADDFPISFMHSTLKTSLKNKLIQLVKENISLSLNDYHEAKIQIIYNNKNQIDTLLVFLLSSKTYSFSITKISLDNDLHVISIQPNYHLKKEDLSLKTFHTKELQCPDEAVEFVSATPVDSYPTAKAAILFAAHEAKLYGYHVKILLGSEATTSNYINYLSCPFLKGFYNVGHGENDGILLDDGILSSDMIAEQLKKVLSEHVVVLFNSCMVFNNPLRDAVIVDAKAQKYTGGITSLRIGPSELASRCFWESAFKQFPLDFSIQFCNKIEDIEDQFGIGGTGNNHLYFPSAHARGF